MSAPSDHRHAPFDPARALRATGGLGLVGAGILGAHLLGFGLPCPLLALTGIQCPFCGTTRAAAALIRGDLAAAWSFNAWTMSIGVGLAVCVLAWTLEVLGGPRIRPPRTWGQLTQGRVHWVIGVTGLGFMVLRNLL